MPYSDKFMPLPSAGVVGILLWRAVLTAAIPSQAGYVTGVGTVYKVLAKIPGSARMSIKREMVSFTEL